VLRAAVNTEPALTRADLISELAASNSPLRIADAELIVVTIFDQIAAALARGERVELRGFGAFTVKLRNARIGHNPRTGPGARASLRGVGDGGKQPAELDRGRELAALLVDGTDRGGLCLGDDHHAGR
jgi:integration host factor subunit beta